MKITDSWQNCFDRLIKRSCLLFILYKACSFPQTTTVCWFQLIYYEQINAVSIKNLAKYGHDMQSQWLIVDSHTIVKIKLGSMGATSMSPCHFSI